MMKIGLPQLLWYENSTLEIQLPDDWAVEICPMKGVNAQALTPDEIKNAVLHPLDSPPVSELAQGKKSAVIIFDDMTRPTKTGEIAVFVLEELLKAGIREDEITFVCALGTHGALTANEFRKKLGQAILDRFRVFNHNIYENCVEVGKTSRGTILKINREVAEAEFKIAIGCVTAHPQAGFSGGGKIILPGISHIDSITHYHLNVEAMDKKSTGMGKYPHNILQEEIEEAAGLAGLDFCINVIVNGRGRTSAVFAGNYKTVFHAAVKQAKDHYATFPKPENKDIVISNAFVKANEMAIAMGMGIRPLKNLTGTVVIIATSPEGQVIHHLLGRWGRNYGGRQYPVASIPPSIKLIIMAPYSDKNFGDWFSNPEVITWTRSWDQTLAVLKKYHGSHADVAVIPDATMQYYMRK
ncbi:MAG: DUF2088 domain-containing protein [Proteobacteria bacterium]|nr:DUF2088 domain-containing protein [Pseudomonadota bacterium]MBU4471890.1 DUF2088 domain-containing protein [Pseudomonadota bacterium]MCG2752834.1 lactate racemase domain-containing protein [Desulfobacteraceae bacterium]